MKLYCVRHGEAESAEIDSERPLTPEGKADIEKLGRYLNAIGVQVPHLYHSGKLRAVQTAQILTRALSVPHVMECAVLLKEDAELQPVVQLILNAREDVMLVGHLPFMYKLINYLLLRNEDYYPIVNFLPGTVACLETVDRQWMLNWIVDPKIILD